ncbi:APC family permease [Nesterenkonia sp. MY13]|uniref:APC family permease n=1 Tax=Nesterenkonia sedimenti TaxID=1463632 RepID=A0A7X8YDM2_9MICC|nr:APC family permease [Nesterenkonia sedimenti]NLS09580.1 APC family permease [Nesterenkonia sedimenti]
MTEGTETRFKRTLGRFEVFFLGFGAMIGFGWIVQTSNWLNEAGAMGAALAFAIGGVIMALVGLLYSELTSAMPWAGGEHNYLMRGLGPRLALIGSWGILGGYVTVVAFEAVAIPNTIGYIIPQVYSVPLWEVAGSQVYLVWALIGIGAAIALTWLNIRGIKPASLLQTSVVLFLFVMILVMIVASIFGGEPGHMEPMFTGGSAGIVAVLVVVPFFFVGFDVIPQSAEEVKLPPKKIGRLVVISVLAAAAFYIAIVLTTSVALPASELVDFELATADAFGALVGSEFGSNFVVAGAIAGLVTSWNAFLVGSSRLMWAMANAGMLPAWFAKLHHKNKTPVNALLFVGGLSVIAPFFGSAMLDWLVDSGSPSIVLTYIMVCITFLVLRKREPEMDRPMRVGGAGNGPGFAIGVLALACSIGMFILYMPGMPAFLAPEPWIMFGAWWLLGIFFLLRLPGGIAAGPNAEHDLQKKLATMGRGPLAGKE